MLFSCVFASCLYESVCRFEKALSLTAPGTSCSPWWRSQGAKPRWNRSVYRVSMILLMEEILHQLIGSLSDYFQCFINIYIYTSQVVQHFFHQQYEFVWMSNSLWMPCFVDLVRFWVPHCKNSIQMMFAWTVLQRNSTWVSLDMFSSYWLKKVEQVWLPNTTSDSVM